jgi:hypothetical protein
MGFTIHYYRHDNLSLLGTLLEADGKAIRSQVHNRFAQADPAGIKVEKVVDNVINAIRTVVDKGYQTPNLLCGDNYETLLHKTAPPRTLENLRQDALAAALLMKPRLSGGSPYLALEQTEALRQDASMMTWLTKPSA